MTEPVIGPGPPHFVGGIEFLVDLAIVFRHRVIKPEYNNAAMTFWNSCSSRPRRKIPKCAFRGEWLLLLASISLHNFLPYSL